MTEIVTLGETMLRLSPPRGERLETTHTLDVQAGGAESNVAVATARLGHDTTWVSKLPDSPLGRRVVGELREHGVRPDVVWSDEGRMGTYYLEHGGAPRGTDVVYDRGNAAVTTLTAAEIDAAQIEDASLFFTSGITPALSQQLAETTATLLKTARDAGTTTAFDLNYRSKLWSPKEAKASYEALLPAIDVLFAAERDVRTVLDRDGDAVRLAHGLATDFGIDTVVVTRSDRGALGLHDGEVHEQPVYETDTFDAIGTGDAFVGGFLSRRLRGGDVPDALQYGAATAALKRTIGGDVAVVTAAEVEAVIADDSATIDR